MQQHHRKRDKMKGNATKATKNKPKQKKKKPKTEHRRTRKERLAYILEHSDESEEEDESYLEESDEEDESHVEESYEEDEPHPKYFRQLVDSALLLECEIFPYVPRLQSSDFPKVLKGNGYLRAIHKLLPISPTGPSSMSQAVLKARKLFDEMRDRFNFSWTATISGYVRYDKPLEALKLYRNMQISEKSISNKFTVSSALAAASAI
ncbi:hypothetical protein EZV62_006001 [Acer yangbiense]|uniref:Uncharacterized protein n=1 Tax=Acer yangbiense TaxID=1000413 RepID=A0A5C7IRJ1_9ROSI|nr:hypothetical protein EZV62_006001 [Acer yangbiense]